MAEYIKLEAAIVIADYAADEHPYDKDPARPETYSDYNHGWNDACDYIRRKLDAMSTSDVSTVRHGRLWFTYNDEYYGPFADCKECGTDNILPCNYCRVCGAKMDRGNVNA